MNAIKLLSPLSIDSGIVRTVTSAERVVIRLSVDLRWYGIDHPAASEWADGIEALTLAIWATTGETPEALLARMGSKIDRAFARQEKESDAMAKRLGLS